MGRFANCLYLGWIFPVLTTGGLLRVASRGEGGCEFLPFSGGHSGRPVTPLATAGLLPYLVLFFAGLRAHALFCTAEREMRRYQNRLSFLSAVAARITAALSRSLSPHALVCCVCILCCCRLKIHILVID